ncbi:IS5 family transposase [Burkholderia ubonensis]|uniref:IS5 family transposase n=1 Tax=Burkholderia ubonensis TaxID=101571 RepID=UPI0009B2FC49|nr:IS5 family transposase [Burkholderia ubonensis]
MIQPLLSDAVWQKIQPILPREQGNRGRTVANHRWFVEAVLWIGHTGCPWRDLPEAFGRWHTVYVRFSRWRRKGVWAHMAVVVAGETEIERILIDITIVRTRSPSARTRQSALSPPSDGREVN